MAVAADTARRGNRNWRRRQSYFQVAEILGVFMIDSSSGAMPRKMLNWAESKSIGGISEIAVLSPIRRGCAPGERRTYEERLAAAMQNLADRHRQGYPTELNRIPAIHFGRMIIIRPEQYLLYSDLEGSGIKYFPSPAEGALRIPMPIDDYLAESTEPSPQLRSFLLTLVEFDGDLKTYMRDIGEFLARDFDTIFENCEDFPTTRNFERFWLWIKRYQINANLFFSPYSNLSMVRIKQLEDFKRRFDELVARIYSRDDRREGSIAQLFEEFLRSNQQYALNFPTPGGIFQADNSQGGTKNGR